MKRLLALTCLALSCSAAPVCLVRGTDSTPNDAERNAARSVTRRLGRWLTDLGIPHEILDDAAAARGLPSGCAVAVLGYNPLLPDAERTALRRFIRGGGRLIVFYGADPGLAQSMGLRLGRYAASGLEPRWRRIRFLETAPPHLPATVRQDSRNIRPVYPAGDDARVIARWEDLRGNPLGDPAWTASPQGFWMSHILLDDGDTPHKKQMLLALLGALHPPLWEYAARCRLEQVRPAVRTKAGRRAYGAIASLCAQGRYSQVIARLDVFERELLLDRARRHPPRPDELRGVWNHSALGLYPGDWARTAGVLSAHGITDLFLNAAWPGLAHYASAVLPRSDTFHHYGDQVAACAEASRQAGLRVHVWKVCWNLDAASPERTARLRRAGRCQVDDRGALLDWLCPSHPENVRLELEAITEIAGRYPVDGVHLDYVRHPQARSCFCGACRRAFETTSGQTAGRWPADVIDGPLADAFRRWRAAQLTDFVRRAADAARGARPGIRVSAAVYGNYPSCIASMGQDWAAWLNNGFIDFACPMNYTEDLDTFRELTRTQCEHVPAHALYPGIGVTASRSRLAPRQVLDQIVALRALNLPGFVLFELNGVLETETLPALQPALAP
ncbi:MAG: family 10 glycosylhydrolase [Lentisphaerae bacterium]|nr:family 10 glycosylhydrolase [Lentisphaerota bacterium]